MNHLGSHTNAVSLVLGVLTALLLLVIPGTIVGRSAQLTWPVAIAVAPAVTYGVVSLAIIPYGAFGIRWNVLSAFVALLVAIGAAVVLQLLLARFR